MLIVNRPARGGTRGPALILRNTFGGTFSIPFGTHREVSPQVYFENKELLDKLESDGVIKLLGKPVVPTEAVPVQAQVEPQEAAPVQPEVQEQKEEEPQPETEPVSPEPQEPEPKKKKTKGRRKSS